MVERHRDRLETAEARHERLVRAEVRGRIARIRSGEGVFLALEDVLAGLDRDDVEDQLNPGRPSQDIR